MDDTDPLAATVLSLQQQVQELRAEREQRQALETMREFEQRMSWFDQKCQASEELADVLGAGSLLAMDPRSHEATQRAHLLRVVDAMETAFATSGLRMTRDQLFSEAVRHAFPQHHAAQQQRAANAATTEQLRNQRGQFVQRATPRNTQPAGIPGLTPEANRVVADIVKRTGIPLT